MKPNEWNNSGLLDVKIFLERCVNIISSISEDNKSDKSNRIDGVEVFTAKPDMLENATQISNDKIWAVLHENALDGASYARTILLDQRNTLEAYDGECNYFGTLYIHEKFQVYCEIEVTDFLDFRTYLLQADDATIHKFLYTMYSEPLQYPVPKYILTQIVKEKPFYFDKEILEKLISIIEYPGCLPNIMAYAEGYHIYEKDDIIYFCFHTETDVRDFARWIEIYKKLNNLEGK